MGHASFFSVAKVTRAHLANSEAPEHHGTVVLLKYLSHTLPEVTGSCTGNDIIAPEVVENRLCKCKLESFDAILRQKAIFVQRLLQLNVPSFSGNPKGIT